VKTRMKTMTRMTKTRIPRTSRHLSSEHDLFCRFCFSAFASLQPN
jgi:hypothetical protein